MHLYWRIIEELKYLNETWVMADPSLSRCFEQWLRKNAESLSLAEQDPPSDDKPFFSYKGVLRSLN